MKNGYTIIRTDEQYERYCSDLEKLTTKYKSQPSERTLDLIETITLLVEKYDEEHTKSPDDDPIKLLKYLMDENSVDRKYLAGLLGISTGHLSDILNYKKGLSKNVIYKLSDMFRIRQEAFNRPYELHGLKSGGKREVA